MSIHIRSGTLAPHSLAEALEITSGSTSSVSQAAIEQMLSAGKEPERPRATASPFLTPACLSISTIKPAKLGLTETCLAGSTPWTLVITEVGMPISPVSAGSVLESMGGPLVIRTSLMASMASEASRAALSLSCR